MESNIQNIILNRIEPTDMLIGMGIVFVLFGGVVIAVSRECERKKAVIFVGLVCLLIGGGMAGIPLYLKYSPNASSVDVGQLVMGACAVPLLLIGVGLLVALYSMTLYKIPRCTFEVEAQVKDVSTMWTDAGEAGGGQRQMNAYAFNFTYCGQEYTVEDPVHIGNPEEELQVGDVIKIKINPNKPEEFYRFRPAAFVVIGFLALGSLFPAVLILLVMFLG